MKLTTIAGAILALYVSANLSAEQNANASLHDSMVYSETKSFLESYGHAVDMDASLIQARNEFLAKGPQSAPSLILLFKETKNDMYRSRIISLLRQLEGDKMEALRLIEEELAKETKEWSGRLWLSATMQLLQETNKDMARKACARILDVDNDRGALLMATAVLKSDGRLEDIAVLERIRERRKQRPLPEGQTVDAVAFSADAAIMAIRDRTHNTAPNLKDNTAVRPPYTPVAMQAKSKTESASDGSDRSIFSKWWLRSMGSVLLLILLSSLLIRRK